jgi:hypothetical protein
MSKPAKNIRKLTLDSFTNISNISAVREDLKSYCLENLREVSQSIESLELPNIEVVPDVPVDMTQFVGTADPGGFKARAYDSSLKANKALLKLRKDQLEELYGIVYSTLTADVKLRVESSPLFGDIQTSYNGFQLWKHVVSVLTSGTPNEADSLRTYRVNQIYYSCIMRHEEHITDFAIRFKDAIIGLKNNGGDAAVVPSGSEQAMRFVESLSPKYAEFRSATVNAISNKTCDPKSIQDILNLATNFRSLLPTNPKSSNTNNSVMYAGGQPSHPKQANRHRFPNSVPHVDPPLDARPRPAWKDRKASSQPQSPPRLPTAAGPVKMSCKYCKKTNHTVENCFKLKQKSTLSAMIETVRLPEDDSAPQPDEYGAWHLEYSVSTLSPSNFSIDEVILDCGAQAHIFGNKNLLTNFRRSEESIFIRGVNSQDQLLEVNTIATFRNLFEVYFSEHSSVNILSYGEVFKSHGTNFDNISNSFTTQKGNLRFSHRNNLYFLDNELTVASQARK